ncbi:MAG TPA: hypothetical protein VJY62_02480 [Bacteroidia bacterium]|nr:hypothetical protein [Bacteroidia bacterium]
MTIEDLLQEILTGANWTYPVSFYTGVRSEHNLMHDQRNFPAVLQIEPVVSSDDIKLSGLIEPTYDIMLLFAMKSELDWPQEKHNTECITPMRQLSRKFIISATNNKKVKTIKNVKRTNFINLFDVGMSGIVFTGSITPQNDETLCL